MLLFVHIYLSNKDKDCQLNGWWLIDGFHIGMTNLPLFEKETLGHKYLHKRIQISKCTIYIASSIALSAITTVLIFHETVTKMFTCNISHTPK